MLARLEGAWWLVAVAICPSLVLLSVWGHSTRGKLPGVPSGEVLAPISHA